MPWKPNNPGLAYTQRAFDEKLSWTERVIIRRIRLGWTKEDLADYSGLTRRTLWRIEMGHNEPNAETREAIEKCLQLGEHGHDYLDEHCRCLAHRRLATTLVRGE